MRYHVFSFFCFCILALPLRAQKEVTGPMGEKFSMRIVATNLSDPWEITYGPDHYLWITESKSYRVSRLDPATGAKTIVLDLSNERQFPRYDKLQKETGGKPWPQGGLMGLALHPQLLSGKPYVYLSYHYRFAGAADTGKGCAVNFGGCYFTARIVRYQYDPASQKLLNPVVLCDTIPASSDHNGGRLVLAPVGGKPYLFYGIGDMGAGQFDNGGRPNHAQQKEVYEGKLLRFNTEADGDAGHYNQWIPNDNPFNGAGQSAVWSYGHRNPQGLAYALIGDSGRLYEGEHGPYSDDEINIVEKGKNYGHPLIIGFADGNYDGLAASVSPYKELPGNWHTSYPLISSEQGNAKAIGTNYRGPIKTFYPNGHSFLVSLFEQIRSGAERPQWASEATSSLDVYTSEEIPGWKNSLLLPSLKHGHLVRVKLNAAGNAITGDTLTYFKAQARYRDLAISPDGKKIYIATDSAAISSGPSKGDPKQVSMMGCIVEYSYVGMAHTGGGSASPVQENHSATRKTAAAVRSRTDLSAKPNRSFVRLIPN
ncbi:MAG: PQQ-dependent sugar dehydrogenase [Williamsia sp.]|nr:PQQ-dependent sugar dehydrogenase [Williamsia sp.]